MRKKKYCTGTGDCDGCTEGEPREGRIDCQGNEIEFCGTCRQVLGLNEADCPECHERAHPGRCYTCGEKRGLGNCCLECHEQHQTLMENI
jgi:hypothetical protein